MSQSIPNVPVTALVPQDFGAQAQRLGYTVVELLWLLAEDLCANPSRTVEAILRGPQPPRSTLAKIVPFPPQPQRRQG